MVSSSLEYEIFRIQIYLEAFVYFYSENTLGGNISLCSP